MTTKSEGGKMASIWVIEVRSKELGGPWSLHGVRVGETAASKWVDKRNAEGWGGYEYRVREYVPKAVESIP